MAQSPMEEGSSGSISFQCKSSTIIDEAKLLVEKSRKLQDEIVNSAQPDMATFANALLPLALDEHL